MAHSSQSPAEGAPLELSDPKVIAAGLAAGGKIARIADANGRLTFWLSELPPDFLTRLANNEITVSARDFIARMENVLGMIRDRQRGRR